MQKRFLSIHILLIQLIDTLFTDTVYIHWTSIQSFQEHLRNLHRVKNYYITLYIIVAGSLSMHNIRKGLFDKYKLIESLGPLPRPGKRPNLLVQMIRKT